MFRKILPTVLAFGLAFGISGQAHADQDNFIRVPGAWVVLVKGEVWGVYSPNQSEPRSKLKSDLSSVSALDVAHPSGPHAIWVPINIAITCPDVDEHVSKIEYGRPGKMTVVEYGGSWFFDKGVTRRITDSMKVGWQELYKIAKQGGQGYLHFTVKSWCKPLVGKAELRTVVDSAILNVEHEPAQAWPKSDPFQYKHVCPEGYEVVDGSSPGYGVQTGYSSWYYEDCRRVDPDAVVPPASPPPVKKSAEEIAIEKYHLALAEAGQAMSVFHKAGIQTIYDLAHTPMNNVTSVLGIKAGKKVRAAAVARSGKDGILDPNWRFDIHFLVDPTWFVDPRLRGTAGAQKKIGVGQKELVKLQKGGIVTLYQLAQADPALVGTKTGGGLARGKELVAAAKKKTEYASSYPWEMGVQRDWVIHPAWMVDPGYLPSAKVIRNQKLPPKPDTGVTVSVTTPKKPAITPPSHKVDPKAKPDGNRAQQQIPAGATVDPVGKKRRAKRGVRSVDGGRVTVSRGRTVKKDPRRGGGIPEAGRGSDGGGGRERGSGGRGDGGIPQAGSGSSEGGGGRKGRRKGRRNRRNGGSRK